MRSIADRLLSKLAPKAPASAHCNEAPEYEVCIDGKEWYFACNRLWATAKAC